MRMVRIIRYANEGFDQKKYWSAFHTYKGEINDYNNKIEVSLDDPLLSPKIHEMSGCYCHFYKYNELSIKSEKGILAARRKDKINIGYLPENYPVFVRNVDPSDSNIISFYKRLQNPEDDTYHNFEKRSSSDKFNWVKMKLSLAINRTESFQQLHNHIPEHISEIYITSEDLKYMRNIKCFPHWFPVSWTRPVILKLNRARSRY